MVGKRDTVMGRPSFHITFACYFSFSPSESMYLVYIYIIVSTISSVHIIVDYNVLPISVLSSHIKCPLLTFIISL
jgi:hypothetical protein